MGGGAHHPAPCPQMLRPLCPQTLRPLPPQQRRMGRLRLAASQFNVRELKKFLETRPLVAEIGAWLPPDPAEKGVWLPPDPARSNPPPRGGGRAAVYRESVPEHARVCVHTRGEIVGTEAT